MYGFRTQVDQLDKGDGFTRDQLDQAMETLEEFRVELSQDEKSALPLIEALTNSLFRAGRTLEIRKIEEWFPDLVQSNTTMRNRMLEHYVLDLFRHASNEDAADRLKMYAKAAWRSNFGETALSEELILLYKTTPSGGDPIPAARRLIALSDSFDSRELANFLNSVGVNAVATSLSPSPRPHHLGLAEVGLRVVNDNANELKARLSKLLSEMPEARKHPGITNLIELLPE